MNNQTILKPNTVDVPVPLYVAGLATRGLYRYLTGTTQRDMLDDATFLLPATKIVKGNPNRKLTDAKWKRVGFRNTFVGLPMGCGAVGVVANAVEGLYGVVDATAPTWSTVPYGYIDATWLLGATLGYAGLGTYRLVHWQKRKPVARIEKMVAATVSSAMGTPLQPSAIKVSPGFFHGDPWVEVPLADTERLDKGFKSRIVLQISERLGWHAPEAEWQTTLVNMRVRIRPGTKMPETVTWAECQDIMEHQDVHHPLLGLGADRTPVYLDFVQESPHSFASGPSGTGKSTLFKMLVAQRLSHGAGLVVLDVKASAAYDYLDALPENMVRVYTEAVTIGEVLLLLQEELHWRKRERKARRGEPYRVLDILVEEANSLSAALGDAWTLSGEKGKCRWTAALGELIFMGREFGMHLHFAAQRAEADVFGGRGSARRGSFQIRMMAQQDEATWDILAKGLPFVPPPQGDRGIWTVVQGQRSIASCRVPYVSDEDAIEYAMRGAGEHLGELTHSVTLPVSGERLEMSEDTVELLHEDSAVNWVTLAQYAERTGDSLGALAAWVRKNGIKPERERPGRAGHLYAPESLARRVPTSR